MSDLPVVDIRNTFGAAFIGLVVSTMSVFPWALLYWYFS